MELKTINMELFGIPLGPWAGLLLSRVLQIVVVVLVAWAMNRLARRAVRASFARLAASGEDGARSARLNTLGGLVASTLGYGIFFIALLMVLNLVGLPITTILTTAGVLGLGVGLGSQRLVRDVIGGFFILLENQFSVGDLVTLGGVAITGTVQEMGLRVTRLRDDVGRQVAVPNGDITTVTNHSRGPLSVAVDLVLPPDSDMAAVGRAVDEAAASLPEAQWESRPKVLGLVEPPEGKLKVRVAGRATPREREAAEMALRAALKDIGAAPANSGGT